MLRLLGPGSTLCDGITRREALRVGGIGALGGGLSLAGLARAGGGTWTVLRAPEGMRAAVHVVPPEAVAMAAITRRVKAAMDPGGILNPGRLYAGM